MQRQQTLGWSFWAEQHRCSNEATGKFFEKPPGMKPAPTQQSSLNEMWRKKAKEDTAMDIESPGATSSKGWFPIP